MIVEIQVWKRKLFIKYWSFTCWQDCPLSCLRNCNIGYPMSKPQKKPKHCMLISMICLIKKHYRGKCANELIYDNYNAVSLGWSLTDKVEHNICSIVIYRANQNVHFDFYWGNELSDHEHILLWESKQYRYILVPDKTKFPKAYMKHLVNDSYANSLSKIKNQKQILHGQTIIKSVSEKKRSLTTPHHQ